MDETKSTWKGAFCFYRQFHPFLSPPPQPFVSLPHPLATPSLPWDIRNEWCTHFWHPFPITLCTSLPLPLPTSHYNSSLSFPTTQYGGLCWRSFVNTVEVNNHVRIVNCKTVQTQNWMLQSFQYRKYLWSLCFYFCFCFFSSVCTYIDLTSCMLYYIV